MAEGFKALSHPSRIEIIRKLSTQDYCCAGDFCCCMPIAQSTVSQHLEMLKTAGIIEWKAQGTKSIYTLNRSRLNELVTALQHLAADEQPEISDLNTVASSVTPEGTGKAGS
ncbi:ArsR/SmtB family transcription factor [Salaquimonas pukyongi]|uniref:ArsR/SmtB family transcription factor n=1 Tax=Salaquimonas pukyongi TaxID=2712698 RepID=UPI0012EC121E|nr:metalloregulator ArsR/SmtB family transcription factor [Salaquimonas pukyongi]